MLAALAAEKVLAADETPVSVLDRAASPAARRRTAASGPGQGRRSAGAPHVMIVRTPDERLTYLQAIASRRKDAIAGAVPARFAGTLIADGYTGYQHLILYRSGRAPQPCASSVAGKRDLSCAQAPSRTRARGRLRSGPLNVAGAGLCEPAIEARAVPSGAAVPGGFVFRSALDSDIDS